jgi:carbon monoxide dehydrogenase subunit G
VGGRLAQVGSRLIDPAARRFVDQFFTAFERLLR